MNGLFQTLVAEQFAEKPASLLPLAAKQQAKSPSLHCVSHVFSSVGCRKRNTHSICAFAALLMGKPPIARAVRRPHPSWRLSTPRAWATLKPTRISPISGAARHPNSASACRARPTASSGTVSRVGLIDRSAQIACSTLRCVGLFLKECVKRKRVFLVFFWIGAHR